ncbi:MAG: PP2C family protein-serine/threonine phosphatase [Rectinemataceae bacterium]
MKGDRILLVDDEREVGSSIIRSLRSWSRDEGLSVVYVESGQEALEELEKRPEDWAVVVSDLQMPGIKGDELIKTIAGRWPDIVTIVLTGNMQLDRIQDFLDSGVFSFVRKPWTKERLVHDLTKAIQLHHFKRGEREVRGQTAQEISLAKEIQAQVLHVELPEDPRLLIDIHRESGAALDFNGDFLDVKRLDENRTLIVLADVSGQALQASFVTFLLKSIMDADLTLVFENRPLSPGSFTEWINRRLCGHGTTVESLFVALLVIEVDLKRELCRWVNAGQPPFVAISEGTASVASAASLPICIDKNRIYKEAELAFPVGSQLIISTDGIFQACQSVAGFGAQEYFDMVMKTMVEGLGARETAEALRKRAGLDEPTEELTMVRILRTEASLA